MKLKRGIAVVVAVGLLVLGLGVAVISNTREASSRSQASTGTNPSGQARRAQPPKASAKTGPALIGSLHDEVAARSAGFHLPAGSENLIAEWSGRSDLCFQQSGVNLDRATKEKLGRSFADFMEIRARFEAGLQHTVKSQGNRLLIDIPAYPEAGRYLESLFYEEMKQILGTDQAPALAALTPYIESRFDHFGLASQQFTVTAEKGTDGLTWYSFTRSATPHYPENPASVDKKGRWGGSTASDRLTLAQMQSGEHFNIVGDIKEFFGPK